MSGYAVGRNDDGGNTGECDAAGHDPAGRAGRALRAFDAASGEERWRLNTGSTKRSSPFVADGTVCAALYDGALCAVRA